MLFVFIKMFHQDKNYSFSQKDNDETEIQNFKSNFVV